jgi:alpha-glucosidase
MPRTLSSVIACWLLSVMSAQAADGIVIRSDGVDIHSAQWTLRVTALADDILRVRAAASGALPEDASWAVPEDMRARSVHVSAKRDADGVEFTTAAISVRIERSPLRVTVSDLAGHVVSADVPTGALDVAEGGFILHKVLTQKEHIFRVGR